MEILHAIILGIIQGLTEFLPVSSSGHLEIAKALLGEGRVAEESLLMTVVLHFATALSTIIIFRKDILELFTREPELVKINKNVNREEGSLKSLKEDQEFLQNQSGVKPS